MADISNHEKAKNDIAKVSVANVDQKFKRKSRPSPIIIPPKPHIDICCVEKQKISLKRKIFYFFIFRTSFNFTSVILLLINLKLASSCIIAELIGIFAAKKSSYILSVVYSFCLIIFILGKLAGIFYAAIELTMPNDQSLNLYYLCFLFFLIIGIGFDIFQLYLNVGLSYRIITDQYKKLLISV